MVATEADMREHALGFIVDERGVREVVRAKQRVDDIGVRGWQAGASEAAF